MILLGVFPVVLLLLQRCLPLPLILSGALYLLTLRFGWQPHSYPDNEAWFFNPLAWQFLFVIGATAGYSRHIRWAVPGQGSWLPKLAIPITVSLRLLSISLTLHGTYEAFPR